MEGARSNAAAAHLVREGDAELAAPKVCPVVEGQVSAGLQADLLDCHRVDTAQHSL